MIEEKGVIQGDTSFFEFLFRLDKEIEKREREMELIKKQNK